MKTWILSISFLLLTLYPLTAQEYQHSADLVFEERVFDFGEIEEAKGAVSHEFKFKNIGQKVVALNRMTSGCGCVQFEFSKEPVRPNGTGKVKVTYNPAYRPGFFSKEVVVLSNQTNYNRIWVKGTVIPCEHPVEEDHPYSFGNGLYLSLKILSFPQITIGTSKEIVLRYANDTEKPITLEFRIEGENDNVSFVNPGKLKAKERGQMTVKYTMKRAIGKEEYTTIYPVINGVKLKDPLLLRVTGSK